MIGTKKKCSLFNPFDVKSWYRYKKKMKKRVLTDYKERIKDKI